MYLPAQVLLCWKAARLFHRCITFPFPALKPHNEGKIFVCYCAEQSMYCNAHARKALWIQPSCLFQDEILCALRCYPVRLVQARWLERTVQLQKLFCFKCQLLCACAVELGPRAEGAQDCTWRSAFVGGLPGQREGRGGIYSIRSSKRLPLRDTMLLCMSALSSEVLGQDQTEELSD